ncbi:MAG: valine--tRNA ligase [Nitrospirae bacterium GWC2_57_13]|jgi:valyl-tRNA synthetase|nr:MAG: valine--tRNA ligase [Nitrospirae bacterium GWC2_57_13]
MSDRELSKTYEPGVVEDAWYSEWEKRRYFHAPPEAGGRAYSIVIPPPNVTGSLHMGHALNATLQDILVRWRRMSGDSALWLPGTDHAGIATQNVVERQLATEKVDRHALGREKFVEKVWEWKKEYGGRIIGQLKKLGASCDWDRERFTMDEGLSKAVREVFVRLYEDGLIYRGERLINWCPRCHTALSDIEVEHEDEKGKLYHIAYPLSDDNNVRLTVATTRPETMLGDTAVAVHPLDPRYKDLIGRTVALPLTSRTIPIVGDAVLVDLEFGTGAVKVTPAHDFNDYEAGLRQTPNLPRIRILDDKADILQEIPDVSAGVLKMLAGKPAKKARGIVVQLLQEQGLLVTTEDHGHAVGKCYRCKSVVEPYLSPQWFVTMQPLAAPAIEAVEKGRITFVPKGWENTYFDWLRNIKDWCISRQIWWGHRIPAWYCDDCGAITVGRDDAISCSTCKSAKLRQETDVLDTWFSSALWPFSTLGWPEKTKELASYYPTSVLVTGFDIIFFWVARMIMMGLHVMKEVPFRHVYIHALVRDAEGQKMSKSKGNVIDPLTMIEQYGADAFRLTLTAMAAQGRDIKLAPERIEGYRNFANKLWNASRFVFMNLEEDFSPYSSPLTPHSSLADRWILSRLQVAIKDTQKAIADYRFNDAASSLYHFIWHEYCDWYLELSKPGLNQEKGSPARKAAQTALVTTLEATLRLLHPIMPFITEEIWQKLPKAVRSAECGARNSPSPPERGCASNGAGRPSPPGGEEKGEGAACDSIMISAYPQADEKLLNAGAEQDMQMVMDAISAIRNIRGEMNIPPSSQISAIIKVEDRELGEHLEKNAGYVRTLARLAELRIGEKEAKPQGAAAGVIKGAEVYVPLEGVLDLGQERDRLGKELERIEKDLALFTKKLSNRDFVERAPKAVVEKDTAKLEELKAKREKLEQNVKMLK